MTSFLHPRAAEAVNGEQAHQGLFLVLPQGAPSDIRRVFTFSWESSLTSGKPHGGY